MYISFNGVLIIKGEHFLRAEIKLGIGVLWSPQIQRDWASHPKKQPVKTIRKSRLFARDLAQKRKYHAPKYSLWANIDEKIQFRLTYFSHTLNCGHIINGNIQPN